MKKNFCILMVFASLVLTACKPTEANYRSAYDAALAKRTQEDPDADILFGSHKQASPLGARTEIIGRDTILSLYAPAALLHASSEAEGNHYRTAVAYYRMEQNAADHARRLAGQGAKGTAVAKLGDEKYIVIVNSAPTREEGAQFTARYRTQHPDGPWIGLTPPEPFLLISPR